MAESCKDCKFFKPKYYGVGMCYKDSSPDAKFWASEKDAYILVHHSFSCSQYELAPDPEKDIT